MPLTASKGKQRVAWLVVDRKGRAVSARTLEWRAASLVNTLNRLSPEGAPHDAVRSAYDWPQKGAKKP